MSVHPVSAEPITYTTTNIICESSQPHVRDIARRTLQSIPSQIKGSPTRRWVRLKWHGHQVPFLFGQDRTDVAVIRRYFEKHGHHVRIRSHDAGAAFYLRLYHIEVENKEAPRRGPLACCLS